MNGNSLRRWHELFFQLQVKQNLSMVSPTCLFQSLNEFRLLVSSTLVSNRNYFWAILKKKAPSHIKGSTVSLQILSTCLKSFYFKNYALLLQKSSFQSCRLYSLGTLVGVLNQRSFGLSRATCVSTLQCSPAYFLLLPTTIQNSVQ